MDRLRLFFRKPVVIITLATLMATLLVMGLRSAGRLEFLELAAYDCFIRLAPKLPAGDRRITLIEISEQDIQLLGRWPLTDEIVARALRILLRDKPRAVGVDIYRDLSVPPGSAELAALFVNNPAIIGVMTMGDTGVAPAAVLRNSEQAAFGDIVVDPGGIVRRGLLYLDDGRSTFSSLALRLASLYLEAEGVTLQPDPAHPQYLRLGQTTVRPFEENDGGYARADARGYQFLLDYRSAGRPFRSWSLADLLAGRVPGEAVNGKVILLGVNSPSVKDHFFTPLSRGLADGQHLPGIALHGHIVSQLLRMALDGAAPIQSPPEGLKCAWLLCWGFLGSASGFRTRSARRFAIVTGGGLLLLFGITFALFLAHWWLPLVPPALAFCLSAVGATAYLTGLEKREREELMQIFSRHVSPEVAEMIWQQRDQFLGNGRSRARNMTVTVLFSDLRGFTALSEQMTPQELMEWLNTYLEAMAGQIMAHGGIVDNYAGDSIKADFGVPLPRSSADEIRRDAVNAVACALAMEQEMHRLNAVWGERGLPAMGIRVGIFTGPVVGGLLGSSQRLKYTTIGDSVNVASRLESFDKEVGKDSVCRILIGDSTCRYLGDDVATEVIGKVSLKGKDEKVTIHRVLGAAAPHPFQVR